jgi:Right handed beta helix region
MAAPWMVVLSLVATACAAGSGPAAAGSPSTVIVSCADRPSDAATLQRAIDASPVGAAIGIKGGTCLLTRPVTLPGYRTYSGGATTGTVLRQDGPMRYVLGSAAYQGNSATTGNPLAIRDLTVACDGSGTTDGIIVMNWQVDIEHVDVSDCGGSGIVDTSAAADGRSIANTSVNSRFDNNFISHSGAYGFEVADTRTAVTDGYLESNQIGSSGQDAIYLQTASGWDVSGNHLYGNGQDGINAIGLYGTTIADNYIEDFGARQSAGTWYGIAGTVTGGVGSTIARNKISNDLGETGGASHIYVAIVQAHGGTGYLAVTGNVIVGARPGDVGFFFSGQPGKLAVTSAGNQVAGVGTVSRNGPGVTLTTGR